jgi:hypothetical protein
MGEAQRIPDGDFAGATKIMPSRAVREEYLLAKEGGSN